MSKFLIVCVVAILTLALSGCGTGDRIAANFTGSSTHCVEGVKYIQFTNGASVMYNQDGTIKTC